MCVKYFSLGIALRFSQRRWTAALLSPSKLSPAEDALKRLVT
jgi:hypothetical protein